MTFIEDAMRKKTPEERPRTLTYLAVCVALVAIVAVAYVISQQHAENPGAPRAEAPRIETNQDAGTVSAKISQSLGNVSASLDEIERVLG